jgi:pyridoxine 5-phosphate synthase
MMPALDVCPHRSTAMTHELKLGVNIDHVATLRQARGTTYPSVLEAAGICEAAGAHGITIHLREDRRHIQDKDVFELRKSLATRMNLEMANNPDIVQVALKVVPDEVCLVPERREELTTEGGLDVAGQKKALKLTTDVLADVGISVSMFVDPDRPQLEACAELGVPYVELHTGAFCDADEAASEQELARLIDGARVAHELGMNVNAGHGINMDNIGSVLKMPFLDTLNIGHSIVARAVFLGLHDAVKEMLASMSAYVGGTA